MKRFSASHPLLRGLACATLALCCLSATGDTGADEESFFPNDRKRVSQHQELTRHTELPPGMPKPPRGDNGMRERLEVVERFLNMPPEKLAMIRSLIERIEQMTPEEKERLRERIREVRSMDGERQRHLMDTYRGMPWQDRVILRQYWQSLSPEQQQLYREELMQMTPEERLARRDDMLAEAKAAGITAPDEKPPKGDRPRRRHSDMPPGQGPGGLPFMRGNGEQTNDE